MKTTLRKSWHLLGGLAVAVLLCLGAELKAQPVTEYWTNGFPESAINGWTTPWTNNAVTVDAVTNSNPPLAGGAYYATFHTAVTNGDTSLYRSFSGGLVVTDIVFQAVFRVDALTNFSTSSDYIGIGDDNGSTGGFGGGSDAIIRAYGASPSGSLPANEWLLYNGGKNGGGFNAALFVDSTVPVVVGDTYVFSIVYHPSTLTYDTTISNANTQVSATTTSLGFRASSFSLPLRFLVNTKYAVGGDGQQLSLGTITANYLNATLSPSILVQPASATNYVGQSQTFTVTASGAGTLAYQWQVASNGTYVNLQNSGPFSGCTNTTLTINNLTLANGTNYQVVVTNKYGSAVSSPAQLVVLPTGPAENITLSWSQLGAYGTDWNSTGWWSTGLGAQTSEAAFPGSTFEVLTSGVLRTVAATYAAFPGQLTVDGDGAIGDVGTACGEMIVKQTPGTNYFPELILNGACVDLGNSSGQAFIEGNVNILNTNPTTIYVDSGETAARGLQLDAYLSGSGNIQFTAVSQYDNWLNVTGTTNTYTGTWDVNVGTLLGSGTNSLGTNNIEVDASGNLETTYDINSPYATLDIEGGQMLLHQDDTFSAVVINGTPLAPGYYSFDTLNADYGDNFPAAWVATPGSTNTVGSGSITVLGTPTVSTNAYLVGLVLNPVVSFSPTFASNQLSGYTATVPFGSVTVTVTNADLTATNTLSLNGSAPAILPSGTPSGLSLTLGATNILEVLVTAQDGVTINPYWVNVIEQPSRTVPHLTGSYSVGNLSLSWPADHLGYRLMLQTNNLSHGISTNASDWGTVNGSTAVTTTNIPVIKSNLNEYYRLVYP